MAIELGTAVKLGSARLSRTYPTSLDVHLQLVHFSPSTVLHLSTFTLHSHETFPLSLGPLRFPTHVQYGGKCKKTQKQNHILAIGGIWPLLTQFRSLSSIDCLLPLHQDDEVVDGKVA
jgi:hypothetical protein